MVDNKVNEGPIVLNNESVTSRFGTGIVGENNFNVKCTQIYNAFNANSQNFLGPSNI